jgi:hypothetical protein
MSYKTSEAIWTKLKKIHDQWPYESIRHVQQQFFDITMEEGKNELTNLGDNTFIDDIVKAKVLNQLLACYKPFQLSWGIFFVLNKPSTTPW